MRDLDTLEEGLRWFWAPVEASGLQGLIYTGLSSVTYAMIRALCERWHTETNTFHLPVREMMITLDDVYEGEKNTRRRGLNCVGFFFFFSY